MSSTHNIHQHKPAEVIVNRYSSLPGVYVEIDVDGDRYAFHLESAEKAIELGYRIYQQAQAVADRITSQPTINGEEKCLHA